MKPEIPFNKSKIVATIGPASNNKDTLRELIFAGADVFRLNFSHGTHDDHRKVIQYVRELNDELGSHVALLQDLQGPKIRTREIQDNGVIIEPGKTLVITTEDIVGTAERISTTYTSLPQDVSVGDMILIDDGNLELRVTDVKGKEVITQIVHGGLLKSRKGINLPNSNVSAPSLTDKDEIDLTFGLEMELDWIALSFVRKAEDILDLKDRIAKAGNTHTKVIAKIEKPEAIENIDAIIAATDGVMVARGDLGVEVLMEEVPMHQKMIVEKCNMCNKPVIIATQMMESMIKNPRPTRAETNDVANAVLDGADALMLSAESASGDFPVQTVKSMVKTIEHAERSESVYEKFQGLEEESKSYNNDYLVATACDLSNKIGAKAIVGMTKSGYTGFRLSMHRPKAPIFIFTDNKKLLNSISLYWGVQGFYYDGKKTSTNETFKDLANILKEKGYLHKGDVFITTAAMPLHWQAHTNMLKINEVE